MLLFVTYFCQCQVDVFGSNVITIGGEFKQTKHTGFYVKASSLSSAPPTIYQNSKFSFVTDKGNAANIDANYFIFQDNNIQMYNLDGFIYLLSYFGNMGSNHNGELNYSLSKYVTTPSEALASVDNAVDYTKPSRFWNFNLIDINASFGKKKLTAGINLDWKLIGLTGPFTWFQDKSAQYTYINMQSATNSKILMGPNIAFRQNIKSLAFVCLAGVNFCANISGDYEKKGDFKINYNPFLKTTLFFGKKAGAYIGLKYEFISAASKLQIVDNSSINAPSYFAIDKMKVNQLELKLGLYIRNKK